MPRSTTDLPALQAAVEQMTDDREWVVSGGSILVLATEGQPTRSVGTIYREAEQDAIVAIVNAIKPLLRLAEALEWAMAPNPRYEGRHRTEPRCNTFMPIDSTCDCGYVAARAALDALSPKGE